MPDTYQYIHLLVDLVGKGPSYLCWYRRWKLYTPDAGAAGDCAWPMLEMVQMAGAGASVDTAGDGAGIENKWRSAGVEDAAGAGGSLGVEMVWGGVARHWLVFAGMTVGAGADVM